MVELQEARVEQHLASLGTIIGVIVPVSYADTFVVAFPLEETLGDFVHQYEPVAGAIVINVYVADWHPRARQVIYLAEQGDLLRARGQGETYRVSYSYTPRLKRR